MCSSASVLQLLEKKWCSKLILATEMAVLKRSSCSTSANVKLKWKNRLYGLSLRYKAKKIFIFQWSVCSISILTYVVQKDQQTYETRYILNLQGKELLI